jgi:hypothetical protein
MFQQEEMRVCRRDRGLRDVCLQRQKGKHAHAAAAAAALGKTQQHAHHQHNAPRAPRLYTSPVTRLATASLRDAWVIVVPLFPTWQPGRARIRPVGTKFAISMVLYTPCRGSKRPNPYNDNNLTTELCLFDPLSSSMRGLGGGCQII